MKSTWREKLAEFRRPSEAEAKNKLTDLQYSVCYQQGTERPFENSFWNYKEPGIYVDVVSGEPLFASVHKFDSGSGWPSFYQPLDKNLIVEKSDDRFGMTRIEVRSKYGDSHLGHLFEDGPMPTGQRFCINSAALRFIPLCDLKTEGYGEFESLFSSERTKS